jgi:hypothetical protein
LSPWLIILVLGISLFSTVIGYALGSIKKETKKNASMSKVKNIIALIFSTAIVIHFLGIYAIALIGAGLFLAKTLRGCEALEELALIGVSAIPLISLFF